MTVYVVEYLGAVSLLRGILCEGFGPNPKKWNTRNAHRGNRQLHFGA